MKHLAAACYLESLGDGEHIGALAAHLLAAYRAADVHEAREIADRVRLVLPKAGDRARLLGAPAQALVLFEQALEFETDPPEIAKLHELAGRAVGLRLYPHDRSVRSLAPKGIEVAPPRRERSPGRAASAGGHYEDATLHLRNAITRFGELGWLDGVWSATAALGQTLLDAHRAPEAIALLEPTSATLDGGANKAAFVSVQAELARAFLLDEQHERAIEFADRALRAAEGTNIQASIADARVTRGTALGLLGRTLEGVTELQAGADLAEEHGLTIVALRAINNRANMEVERDPRAALEFGRAGLAMARRLGERSWIVRLLINVMSAALRTGEWEWAILQLTAVLGDDLDGSDRVLLLEPMLEFRALRGEPVDDLAIEIGLLVGKSNDPGLCAALGYAEAYSSFAAMRFEDARRAWRQVAAFSADNRADCLARAARAGLWARNS